MLELKGFKGDVRISAGLVNDELKPAEGIAPGESCTAGPKYVRGINENFVFRGFVVSPFGECKPSGEGSWSSVCEEECRLSEDAIKFLKDSLNQIKRPNPEPNDFKLAFGLGIVKVAGDIGGIFGGGGGEEWVNNLVDSRFPSKLRNEIIKSFGEIGIKIFDGMKGDFENWAKQNINGYQSENYGRYLRNWVIGLFTQMLETCDEADFDELDPTTQSDFKQVGHFIGENLGKFGAKYLHNYINKIFDKIDSEGKIQFKIKDKHSSIFILANKTDLLYDEVYLIEPDTEFNNVYDLELNFDRAYSEDLSLFRFSNNFKEVFLDNCKKDIILEVSKVVGMDGWIIMLDKKANFIVYKDSFDRSYIFNLSLTKLDCDFSIDLRYVLKSIEWWKQGKIRTSDLYVIIGGWKD